MKYHTLFLSKIGKDVAKFVVCCSGDWHFKVNYFSNTLSGKEISSDLLCHFHIITRLGDDVTLRSKRWGAKFLNISLGIYITPVNSFS